MLRRITEALVVNDCRPLALMMAGNIVQIGDYCEGQDTLLVLIRGGFSRKTSTHSLVGLLHLMKMIIIMVIIKSFVYSRSLNTLYNHIST